MIVFIRHGEAAAGWGSHPDPGLSEKGHAQADAAAETLSALGLTQIFSSPMQRCRETAAAFAQRSGLPVTLDPDVSEIPTPPGTEDRVSWLRELMSGSWDEAEQLIRSWRQRLLDRLETLPDNSAVFSHFVAINTIVGHLEGSKAVTVFRPDHCSLTTLERNGEGLRLAARGGEAGTQVL